jgi:penicillin-binding protein 1A
MGVTPNLVTGVWVGADDPRIHFRSTALGQGANTALPIYATFTKKLNRDPAMRTFTSVRFRRPPAMVLEKLECPPFVMELDKDQFDFWDLFQSKDEKKKRDKKRKGLRKLLEDIFG